MNFCKDCKHHIAPTSAPAAFYGGVIYSMDMCNHPEAKKHVVDGRADLSCIEARGELAVGATWYSICRDGKLFEKRTESAPEPLKLVPGSIVYAPSPEPTRSTWERVKGWFI